MTYGCNFMALHDKGPKNPKFGGKFYDVIKKWNLIIKMLMAPVKIILSEIFQFKRRFSTITVHGHNYFITQTQMTQTPVKTLWKIANFQAKLFLPGQKCGWSFARKETLQTQIG